MRVNTRSFQRLSELLAALECNSDEPLDEDLLTLIASAASSPELAQFIADDGHSPAILWADPPEHLERATGVDWTKVVYLLPRLTAALEVLKGFA